MRRLRYALVAMFAFGLVSAVVVPAISGHSRVTDPDQGDSGSIPEGKYLQMREAQIAKYRGVPWHTPYNARARAFNRFRAQESLAKRSALSSPYSVITTPLWTELGPAPIPNGQPNNGPDSGRVSAIAVDPNNANVVYIGAAQGGVWRTIDGGAHWTALMDNAQSLAIGALALTSDGNTLWVGTGEGNFAIDSFFGVGLYRISDPATTATVAGPFDTRVAGLDTTAGNGHAFSGASVSGIAIDPSNSAHIWVSTTVGIAGIGSTLPPDGADTGLYYSNNATDTTPTFALVGNVSPSYVTDVALKPGSSDVLLVVLVVGAGSSGIYRSTMASVAASGTDPTFSKVKGLTSSFPVSKLAFSVSTPATVYAAYDDDSGGAVIKSTNSGSTWPTTLASAHGHCDGQCWYDDPIAVDPRNANIVLIGGNYDYSGTGPSHVLMRTTNGSTFNGLTNEGGMHPDDHAIAFSSDGNTVWTANDGGVWKSTNAGAAWTNENTAGLGITQFQSIFTHPTDTSLSIGGTQDNGTEKYSTSATWSQSDGGDGGFALIDQSSTSTTTDTMYHTFFNGSGAQIGFARSTNGGATWPTFLGCGGTANGINCADGVLFYAPMALGPGTPNTLYFGTDHLYRSSNSGTTMTSVSQNPLSTTGCPNVCPVVSAIGIAPSSDSVRVVALSDGEVWGTTTGSSTLTDMSSGLPSNAYVARAVIDPSDANTAYVTFDNYFGDSTAHVWKTTNLNGSPPTWLGASSGIPDVPVNAFVIDPNNSSHLFAGTDVGVYESTDGGSTWNPFGTGLPNAAVFDLAIGSPGTSNEVLRAATHGRGIWEIPISGQAGSHTLTVRENGSGSGAITSADSFINCGSTCSHRYVDGTSVTLTATASAGSVFAGWANCATPSGSTCDETISADKTVTATFNSTGAAFRPDLWIRDLKGIQHGNNVYCSTACKKQTVKGFGPPGAKGTFSVTIQNDGTSIDTIDVTGPGNSTRLSLKYVSGPSCCPTPLRAHEVNVPPGAKGGVIKIVVSVKKGAPLGSQAVTIVGKSHGHTVKDVVKIVVVVTKPAAHSSNMRVT